MDKVAMGRIIPAYCVIGAMSLGFLLYSLFRLLCGDYENKLYEIYFGRYEILSSYTKNITVTPEYSIYMDRGSVVVESVEKGFFWKEYFSYTEDIIYAYFAIREKEKWRKKKQVFCI